MRIDILSVVPELLESPLKYSIVGRAIKKGLVEIHVHNIRKYGIGSRATVDDYSYGGDAGMVMMVEPVERMINELRSERDYDEIIYLSPDGELLNQGISNELSLLNNIMLLCGHYKGIDERIREHLITREISVGDYVVSGGEIPAALLADSIVRLLPGALTDETRQLSRWPAIPSCLHEARRLQGLESPGSASERQSETYQRLAGRTGRATDKREKARTSGKH